MYELKDTLADTIGKGWRIVRTLSTLTWIAALVVYQLASHDLGFLMLIGASIVGFVMNAREYVIASLYRIRNITQLRVRLLLYGDGEYVLQDLARDQLWRGEPVDPEIVKKLAELDQMKQELTSQITKIATELFNPAKVEDKTPN